MIKPKSKAKSKPANKDANKKKTPKTASFVLEFPLKVSPSESRIIQSRMEAGRRLYNVTLAEALARLKRLRDSSDWQAARLLPEGDERTQLFNKVTRLVGFSEYSLHAYVKPVRINAGWEKRLSAQEAQKIATRVFKTVKEYAFKGKGKPRFKGKNRPLRSLEGKQNTTGIRFKQDLAAILWDGLTLPVMIKDTDYNAEALANTTKYCRIVWRKVKGDIRYYVQLVQTGIAPNKHIANLAGQVGLDLGPSTIAIVTEKNAALEKFAPSVIFPWIKIRCLQRKLDRSRRACNPKNYHENGTAKKGCKTWIKSANYLETLKELQEVERKLTASRKRDHGTLINNILAQGATIQTEKVSHKAWQKLFGRSAKVRGSGLFFSELKRKAESAGGKVIELNTRVLKMSQYDHVTGLYTKKPLSQRHHNLGDNLSCVQRDIYSAFLALNVQEDSHNHCHLVKGWTAMGPLLRRTGLCVDQSANGKASAFPPVSLPSERIVRHNIFGTGHGTKRAIA